MEVKRYSTKQKAREAAAQKLNQLLDAYSHVPMLFLSSGGSSLELLDGLEIGENVAVSVLDGRYSTDPQVNNFSQLLNFVTASKIIDTRVQEGESLEALAKRFERGLRDWKDKHPTGKIIITQGMGPDGHTSGIMPYPEDPQLFEALFNNTEHWVAGYDAKEKNEYPLRVTTTMTFLRIVDYSVAYITGEKKTAAFERVLAESGSLAETPARIMREMKDIQVFTDIV